MDHLKNCFAVVCEWPEANAAENETALRLKRAGSIIGKNLIIINKKGEILKDFKASGKYLESGDVDFVINLHFASPKAYDAYSYVALWNPIKFYFDWDYRKFSIHLLTHNDFISCKSTPADDQIIRMITFHETNHLEPEITINHTNSGPYYKFEDSQRDKVFYCGINWDKFGGKKSRFSDLFKILDKKNILKIYGPEKLSGGLVPWEGFVSYQGSIPFDGTSTFSTISQCLLGLALSHEAHIESEIASSRLFEIIAGGALPICDQNPFFKKFFGDKVLYVHGESDEEKAQEIINHYSWAEQNKNHVKKMVQELQEFMQQNYDLAFQLKEMYEKHKKRRAEVEAKYLAQTNKFKVNILYFCEDKDDDFLNLKNSIKSQVYKNIKLTILANFTPENFSLLKSELTEAELIIHGCKDKNKIGKAIEKFQQSANLNESDLFLLTNKNEKLLHDHISSLVRIFEYNPENKVAASYNVITGKEAHLPVFDNSIEKTPNSVAIGSFIIKELPPLYITRYLHPRNYLLALKKLHQENFQSSKRPTIMIETPNSLDYGFDFTERALSEDFPFHNNSNISEINQNLLMSHLTSKDFAYKLIKKIKVLKIFLLPRKLSHIIRNFIRKIRKKLR